MRNKLLRTTHAPLELWDWPSLRASINPLIKKESWSLVTFLLKTWKTTDDVILFEKFKEIYLLACKQKYITIRVGAYIFRGNTLLHTICTGIQLHFFQTRLSYKFTFIRIIILLIFAIFGMVKYIVPYLVNTFFKRSITKTSCILKQIYLKLKRAPYVHL